MTETAKELILTTIKLSLYQDLLNLFFLIIQTYIQMTTLYVLIEYKKNIKNMKGQNWIILNVSMFKNM